MVFGSCRLMASSAHPDEPFAPARTLFHVLPPSVGLVNAALVVVVPQMAGRADQNVVAIRRIDQNFGDVLGIFQADVGPVLAAVGRFVDAVTDGHAVAHPRFAGADPNCFRIGGINAPPRQSTARPRDRTPACMWCRH